MIIFFFFFISKFCSKIVVKYIYLLVICLEVKLFYIVNKNFKVIMIIFIYFMIGKIYFIMIVNLIVKYVNKLK